jgi:phosphatidylglycerol:prolipoprotein diacylglycerol transferase
VTAYGCALLAALVLGWAVARRRAEIDRAHVDRLAPLVVAAGLSGAFALGWLGGGPGGSRGLFGALVLGVAAGIAYALWHRLPLGRVGDTFAVSLPLGIAAGRVGCFLEGCCRGTLTAVPWAVDGRHPTQLYESAGALAVLALVLVARRRRVVPGEAFLAFGTGYGALRFALEPLRGNHVPLAAGLTVHQWLAAVAVAACSALFLARRRLYASSRSSTMRRSSESPGLTG